MLTGLGTAGALSLLAVGLVVTFKGSGILNFAHGAVATAAVYVYIWLYDSGWPIPVAILMGLLAAVAIAAIFQLLVIRRLSHAPALAKVVAALGLMILIQGTVGSLTGEQVPSPPTLLSSAPINIPGGYFVGQAQLYIFVIALVVTAIAWAAFRWTRFGLITQALAENEQAVTLTGTSAQRVSLINWCVGALLAGGAGILLSSLVPIDPDFFTIALVSAIAAALVGGLRSFWWTFVGAIGIGVVQPLLVLYTADLQKWTSFTGWPDALPFILIAIVVIAKGRSIPLRDFTSHLSLLPRVGLPKHPVRATAIALVAGILWFAFLPVGWINPMSSTLIGALICLSLVVIVGYVGQVSLAQMAFAGFGAFTTSLLAEKAGLPFPLPLILGALAAVPLGVIIGLPALRVRGIQLAVVTLGAGLAIEYLIFNDPSFAGGDVGAQLPAARLGSINMNGVTHPRSFGILVLIVFCLSVLGVAAIRRSPLGQRFLAVRVNERGASASGVSVTQSKLAAFAISAFLAGLAGGLMGYQSLLVSASSFDIFQSILFMGVAYVGGITTFAGAFIGGLFAPTGVLSYIGNLIWNSDWEQALSGLVLLQVVAAHPDGLAGIPAQIRRARQARRARLEREAANQATSKPETAVPAEPPLKIA